MRRKQPLEQVTLSDVFEREVEAVFGFLLLRCGSRAVAEDLTGETFTAAARRFADGRGGEVTAGWLCTVARRRLIDHWRREYRHERRVKALQQQVDRSPAHESDPDGAVEFALGTLPARQRTALVLRYIEGFSTTEVAELLGTSYKAAESLVGRARAAFTESFAEVKS